MSGSGHLRSESGKESLYLSGGEYGLGQGYDAAFLKVWPRSEKTALQLSEMGTKMKRADDEETQVEWEGPRGARPALVGGALRLHASPGPPPLPRLPAATRLRMRPPSAARPSQPEAGGGPQADVIQSREGDTQGTAPGARLTNRRMSGGLRALRLPSAHPAPQAPRRAAPLRGPRPPPGARGGALLVSLGRVATRPTRELGILRAAGQGGVVRKVVPALCVI